MSLRIHAARPAAALLLAIAALSPLLTPPTPARAQAASGVKVSVLHTAFVPSTLTVGPDGSFFGTDNTRAGTLFKVTLGGLFHTLIAFNGTNGVEPSGGPLLPLPDGSFFGSTSEGGKSGTGVLFRFTPKRRYQIKHEFASIGANTQKNVRGAFPQQPMVLGRDGAIYGVASGGGSLGGGVLFRYTEAKGVEVLHNFAQYANCYGGLTLGPDGALYGTSTFGSLNDIGQIFRATKTGGFTVLHTFTGVDGAFPNGVPVVGPDGALYGTTEGDGINNNGTAYRITTDGDFTLLHTFTDSTGAFAPRSPLVVGPDGRFYGKTSYFEARGTGAIYRMTADGSVTVLYTTPAGDENIGASNTAPVFGRDNRLYVSGVNNIYKITVPF